jgi:hypothetical protein
MGLLRRRRPVEELIELAVDAVNEARGTSKRSGKATGLVMLAAAGIAGVTAASARISALRRNGEASVGS